MKKLFSMLAVSIAAVVVFFWVSGPNWRSTAPTGKYDEFITEVGKFSFQKGQTELEIFKDEKGLLRYKVTRAKRYYVFPSMMQSLGPVNGNAGINEKWFFLVSQKPFAVWYFNGVDRINVCELSGGVEIHLNNFSDSSEELKEQVPPKFFEALPQSVREKIKIDAKISAAPTSSPVP